MSLTRRRPAGAALLIAVVAAGAVCVGCQPLPHPFADDRPPRALIRVPDSANIAVATFTGEPHATADKLGAALASALLKHEIPATDRSTSVSSYRLEGRIQQGPVHGGTAAVTMFWRLRNAKGRVVVERDNKVEAPVRDWEAGSDDRVARLAEPAAAELAALLADEAPRRQPQQTATAGDRTLIAVRRITGAPGDGDRSLASAVSAVLKRSDLDIVDKPDAKHDVDIDADISVDAAKADKQHVKIVWRVARAGGPEIGTVAQENDVPRGQLDGAWGDIAYTVALAAQEGLVQLVSRASPPIRVSDAPAVPATPPTPPSPDNAPPPPPPNAMAAPPAGGATGAPVPGTIAPMPSLSTTTAAPVIDPAPYIPYRGVPLTR